MKILVTGGAGFIGSAIVDALVKNERVTKVTVLDNLETGKEENLLHLRDNNKLELVIGDIRNYETCLAVSKKAELICHQAGLGSVPRSVIDPLTTNDVNITGTLNIFNAARENKIKRVVYASSSSVYGDHAGLPKTENEIGSPLSPYSVTKLVDELYAKVFADIYKLELIGLRYFNAYGPKQNPNGPYAAVIPLFIKAFLDNKEPVINGNGDNSRDFTYINDVVQANMLALFTENKPAINQIYNIAGGGRTTLNELVSLLQEASDIKLTPIYGPERQGDVKHSQADISKANLLLGFQPATSLKQGITKTFNWYKANSTVFITN